MKFTKILDMTDNESSIAQSEAEDENIQFDESEMMMNNEEETEHIQHDLDVLMPESKEMMSDWTCAEIKVDEITSDEKREEMSPTGSNSSIESMDSFYKPEADQSGTEQTFSEQVANALRRDARDHATIARDNKD